MVTQYWVQLTIALYSNIAIVSWTEYCITILGNRIV